MHETMANSKAAMNRPRRSRPITNRESRAARARAAGTITAAPPATLSSLPQRSVRAADVVEAASSRAPSPKVTAAKLTVRTPNSSSSHGPNVTNKACVADIRQNIPITASHPGRPRRALGSTTAARADESLAPESMRTASTPAITTTATAAAA
jgi:hypothetical protein